MPANRPRSASSPRARAPPLPRRASAKDVSDLGSSRLASRSTTSIATTVAAESFEDDADAASTKSSVKSRRARLPSFSTASDTVTSVASGLGTFGRNKTNTASASILGSSDSSRPSEGRSWSFMGRKRDTGFQAMDERELARVREGSGASGEPGKRNSQEVNEFLSGVGIGIDAAPSSAAPLRRSLTQPTSPISPAFPSASHLGVDVGAHEGFNSHHDFLGVSAFPFPSPHQPLESQATGVSVLSDGDDNPFGQTPLSPQETGQSMMGMGSNAYGDGDDGHDDEFETAALTGNRNGATQSVTRTNGNSPFGLGGTTAATLNRLRGAPPPPPPIPSGSLLGRKAPPPPPMPRRATTSFGGH